MINIFILFLYMSHVYRFIGFEYETFIDGVHIKYIDDFLQGYEYARNHPDEHIVFFYILDDLTETDLFRLQSLSHKINIYKITNKFNPEIVHYLARYLYQLHCCVYVSIMFKHIPPFIHQHDDKNINLILRQAFAYISQHIDDDEFISPLIFRNCKDSLISTMRQRELLFN